MVKKLKATIARARHADTSATSLGELSNNRKTITMIGVLLAMLLSALDQTIVGTALPRIVSELGGFEHLSWVVTAYLLASTVTVPIYGKLSDMYGRKWFFFSGIVIFLVGSVLCGLSGSMTQLIVFRAIQGIGGGAIMGNAFAIIGDLFPPRERGKWQGIMGGVFGLSSVIGPALGGFLTDHASWRWVFYVNIPLGLVALAFIGLLMPKVVPHLEDKVIDYLGAILLTVSLVTLLLGLIWGGKQYAWGSLTEISLFVGGAVSLVLFLLAERVAKQPILPLDLFRNRTFVVSAMTIFISAMAMFGSIVYIPLFAQLVIGTSATSSGTILTPLMVGLIGASIVSGQVVSRTGRYRNLAIGGFGILTIGLFWLAHITAETGQLGLALRMVVAGAGLGTTFPIFNIAVQNAFDNSRIGVVTASTQLFRNVGQTVGTAIFGSIFNNVIAQKTAYLADNTFIKSTAEFHPLDGNKIQALLTPAVEHGITAKLALIPGLPGTAIQTAFIDAVSGAKIAFASTVAYVFLIGACIALVGFVLTFFLPEVALKGGKTKPGEELATELGQADDERQHALVH